MNTNVNLEAALGVLAFLGSCVVLLILSFVAVHALVKGRGKRFVLTLSASAVWFMIYLSLMLVFSIASSDKVLARGEEKHFCELDCHLAYAVTDVQKMKAVGPKAEQVKAEGVFYVVTVRTRFDEETIGRGRGDALLTPNSRIATARDAQGRVYNPSPEGTRALELAGLSGTPIHTPLRPGQFYTTAFVFDLPENVYAPTLSITEGEPVTRFVIGHENSLLHRKVLFRLDDTREQVVKSRLSKALSFQAKGIVIAILKRLKGYD